MTHACCCSGQQSHSERQAGSLACFTIHLCSMGARMSHLHRAIAGLFVFAYCFYFYKARSDMSGLMQTR